MAFDMDGRSWGSAYPGVNGGAPINPFGTPMGGGYRDQALRRLAFSLEGPYNEAWQQGQINRNADALATSSAQANEQLRNDASARGLAFNDPSFQANRRAIDEDRRRDSIAMAGDVRRAAAGANFSGGLQAANSLLGATQPMAFGGGYRPAQGSGSFFQMGTGYNSVPSRNFSYQQMPRKAHPSGTVGIFR